MSPITIRGLPNDQLTESVIRGLLMGAALVTTRVEVTTFNHEGSFVHRVVSDVQPMIKSEAQGWLDTIDYVVGCCVNPDIKSWKVVIG